MVLNKAKLAKTVGELEKSEKNLRLKLENAEKNIKKLSLQLEEEKKENVRFTGKIKQKEAGIKKVKADVTKFQKENTLLLNRLESLNKTFDDMKSGFDRLINAKQKSEGKIKELRKRIEGLSKEKETTSLGSIVVR